MESFAASLGAAAALALTVVRWWWLPLLQMLLETEAALRPATAGRALDATAAALLERGRRRLATIVGAEQGIDDILDYRSYSLAEK